MQSWGLVRSLFSFKPDDGIDPTNQDRTQDSAFLSGNLGNPQAGGS